MLITDHSVNIHKGKHQTLIKEYILSLQNNSGKISYKYCVFYVHEITHGSLHGRVVLNAYLFQATVPYKSIL